MKIHFGEVDDANGQFDGYFVPSDSTAPGDWINPFTKSFDFFTNKLGKQGVSSYDWAFYFNPNAKTRVYDFDTNEYKNVKKYNGVLTNMWRGCEPVCAILSKLLKNGVFCSYPWNPGVGYMFRRKTPKLVFVFANEFDNSYTTTYDYYSGQKIWTTVVVPSANNDTITFTTKSSSGTSVSMGILGTKEKKVAIDQFCLKQLSNVNAPIVNSAFMEFMSKIGLSEDFSEKGEMIDSIASLAETFNFRTISDFGYSEPQKADVFWKIGDTVKSATTIAYGDYVASMDLDNNPTPFKGMDVTKLLSNSQMKSLEETATFPGI